MICNKYIFIYLFDIRYKVATIHLISGRLSLLYSEYKRVTGDLCRNYADKNN
jgi:hypothetical protein